LLNYATGTISTAVVLVTGFVATPFLLKWLGEEQFGAFRAASDWFAYLALLELGVGGALLALLAKAVGRAHMPAIQTMLGTGIWWYTRITAVMIVAGICLSAVITELVPVRAVYADDLQRGVLIALLGLLLLPLGAPLKALAEARQRGYWVNWLLLLQSLLITGFALWFAWKGWGVVGQFAAVAIGGLLFNLAIIFDGIREYPQSLQDAVVTRSDPEAHRELRRLNWPTFVFNISGRLSLQSDNIIVAAMMGPAAVVPLFMTQKLITLALGQLANVGGASWAALAELHFQGDRELFNQRLVELTSVVAVFGVAGLVPIAIYNRYFVMQWVGLEHYAGDWVSIIAAVNAFILALLSLWGWCFGGTGRTPLLMRSGIIETVINVGVSLMLTSRLGLVGPLVGTLTGFTAVSLWYIPKLLQRVFGTPLGRLAKATLAPLALGVPYAGGVWWMARSNPPAGWLNLGGHMAAAVLVYLGLCWLLLLDRETRRQITQRLVVVLAPGSK
jgi:O-antigen/teichoic acid export membrane protein